MENSKSNELMEGLTTAFINQSNNSNLAYQPEFIYNDHKQGKKVLVSLEQELKRSDEFFISVAFITDSGFESLSMILKELEQKGIPGKILTTDYLTFSQPKALDRLAQLKNIELKMFRTNFEVGGFHTKGYIFREDELYRIIIGSSNMTSKAITENKEWNTKIVSTEQGEVAQEILNEFKNLWMSPNSQYYEEFIDDYKERYLQNQIIKKQQRQAAKEQIVDFESYKLKPNKMQLAFINNLMKMRSEGIEKALLLSSTGTGKTYASAFAVRELGYQKVLFLVHRNQIAEQALKSYQKVLGPSITMGLVTGKSHDYGADFIFATVQTLSKTENLERFARDHFECCIYDEAHHTSADSYKKVMDYFTPQFTLGMTATPDKKDDHIEGRNIYEIFDHNIAYEIRLQKAMEEDLLCPFHYFGITDLEIVDDTMVNGNKLTKEEKLQNFRFLTSDERVKYVMEQAEYYGYSGNRVKGLIFCSRIEEANELSKKFNEHGWRTLALSGADSEEVRRDAIERLVNDDINELDYILSVDIFSEGVDVPEINQVIMLRPTQSPIVFIQQLGRGLRKAEDKEYVVILDFIGNYKNNFMIPIALSGDRSYNKDNVRKYVVSGNSLIPGASTIHFDEISKERIFNAVDNLKSMKALIKESYTSLKNRLGRIPRLVDFYENEEIDPMIIIREYKTYYAMLKAMEKKQEIEELSDSETLILEYLSKTILSGVRPQELELLKMLLEHNEVSIEEFQEDVSEEFGYLLDMDAIQNTIRILQGHFHINSAEHQKYAQINILKVNENKRIQRLNSFVRKLNESEFRKELNDIISFGLHRYKNKYNQNKNQGVPFVLYEQYSRRDVCFLMNCEKDLSSVMYGMKRIKDDVFIFVTYHKKQTKDISKKYVDGKPDYEDIFESNQIFSWDTQLGKGVNSSYSQNVITAPRKHLMIQKRDSQIKFYYLGQFPKWIAKLQEGSVRQYFYYDKLCECKLKIPNIDEQKQIAKYLDNIDSLITLHQRKLEKLQNMKKSCLQKMFPKDGATVPEIRFSEFQGDWEERTLGSCFDERLESLPDGELLSVTIGSGIKKFSELDRHDNSNTDKSKYKRVCIGDIAYNSMRMWQGASGRSSYEGIVSPAYTVVKPIGDIDTQFFAYMFKKKEIIRLFEINSQGLTSDTWNLKYPAFSKIVVRVPRNVEEQSRIARFLLELDELISCTEQEIEITKRMKKGCLQKMFV